MATYFVSGHLDLTPEEFETQYVPQLAKALQEPEAEFVVGDARGADAMTQEWLAQHGAHARVFHMLERPRNHQANLPLVGGFSSDDERDAAMTAASTHDIAWLRAHRRSNFGTARNLQRRRDINLEAGRNERRALPRWIVDEIEVYPVLIVKPAKEGHPTVPIPADLVERYTKAHKAWAAAQREIQEWASKQENYPV